jgi:hypothetical protein
MSTGKPWIMIGVGGVCDYATKAEAVRRAQREATMAAAVSADLFDDGVGRATIRVVRVIEEEEISAEYRDGSEE